MSIDSAAPVVVKTFPQAGADSVDPATQQLSVTFSKDMKPKSWSWAMTRKESFPQMTGEPKYLADKRTCVLPVKLEPNTTYEVWINSQKFSNFKDAAGRPALPYMLVFKTAE